MEDVVFGAFGVFRSCRQRYLQGIFDSTTSLRIWKNQNTPQFLIPTFGDGVEKEEAMAEAGAQPR